MNQRLNRNRLTIGTYYLASYARTERHIRELSEAGIDLVIGINADRPTLDLFQTYGIGAIVSGVLPHGRDGLADSDGRSVETKLSEIYEEAAAQFVDHPAIWGLNLVDEPSSRDFPYYGSSVEQAARYFPYQFPFLNLLASYGVVHENTPEEVRGQFGTDTYEEYIARYCDCVNTDYISYDHYPCCYSAAMHYENLRIVSEACLRTGRSLWIILQVNSPFPEHRVSENEMRFQAYSALAFGAESIFWACYTPGWWHYHVLDRNGNKTEQYDKLKRVNAELRTIAEPYMQFRRVATHFVGFDGHEDRIGVKQSPIASLHTDSVFNLKADNGAPLLVGEMVSRNENGAEALMVFAADDPHALSPQSYSVTFRVATGKRVTVWGGEGQKPIVSTNDGSFLVSVVSNEGILIVTE